MNDANIIKGLSELKWADQEKLKKQFGSGEKEDEDESGSEADDDDEDEQASEDEGMNIL